MTESNNLNGLNGAAEVLPGIYRLRLPLYDNPLQFINAYLIRGENRCTLIDTGWDTPDCFAALEQQLNALGFSLEDIGSLVVTHIHVDHYGLAGKLRQLCRAHLALHKLEKVYIDTRYKDFAGLLEEMTELLRMHGAPDQELAVLSRASLTMLDRTTIAYPDLYLEGGEVLAAGPYEFDVIWTPGHSAGHVCLHDPKQKIFLSGDHVLARITPNIGFHVQSLSNPLADYLDSLRAVAALDVQTVLPAHGETFHDLNGRVREIIEHHEERMAQIGEALGNQARTTYQVAARIPWRRGRGGWDDLDTFNRRIAVTEALAHLEVLRARGRIRRYIKGGRLYYVAMS